MKVFTESTTREGLSLDNYTEKERESIFNNLIVNIHDHVTNVMVLAKKAQEVTNGANGVSVTFTLHVKGTPKYGSVIQRATLPADFSNNTEAHVVKELKIVGQSKLSKYISGNLNRTHKVDPVEGDTIILEYTCVGVLKNNG